MKPYSHLFFDLDHTLWDFNANCRLTLDELYEAHNLSYLGFSKEDFYTTYKKINDRMWDQYHKGNTTKEEIRTKRFEFTFSAFGYDKSVVPKSIDEEFLRICPAKGQLFPHTIEVLTHLQKVGFKMHIITNGFKETQHVKLSSSGLSPFFELIVESDVCGFMKPDLRIFKYALENSGANAQESLMIGDDLYADILGAKDAGMDQVFVNRHEIKHREDITHEINCLSSLKNILTK